MVELSKKSSKAGLSLPRWAGQVLKYGAIGALSTVIDLVVYSLLIRWIGLFAALPVAAKAISYGTGMTNSYVGNRSWTFRSSASATSALGPFLLANLGGLVINTGVMQLAWQRLGLSMVFAWLLASAAVMVWNFTSSKYVVFRVAQGKIGA